MSTTPALLDNPQASQEIPLVAEPLSATRNFISDYADYADVIEAPRVAHEIVAEQVVAAILNKNGIRILLGNEVTLDTWQVLLSGSGLGRSTLVRMMHPILQGAGLSDLVQNIAWGSESAALQGFAESPSGLFLWGEMSEHMKKLNSPNFPGLKVWLTDRYDDPYPPSPVSYRVNKQSKRNTPPIHFDEAPRINILATSSEDWFFNSIAQSDSTGGLMPRWMINKLPHTDRCIPIPQRPDADKAVALIYQLKKINLIGTGLMDTKEVDFSPVKSNYESWYRAARARFDAQPNPGLAGPYFNRHREHIKKLAAIYTAASSNDLTVTEAAWNAAVERARGLEVTIFKLLPTGMSEGGYERSKMLREIEASGDDGLTLSDLTRAFQSIESWKRRDYLATLISSEDVFAFVQKTTGRPSFVFVAKTHKAGYQRKHPGNGIAPIGTQL
jgi:hypothetical protein